MQNEAILSLKYYKSRPKPREPDFYFDSSSGTFVHKKIEAQVLEIPVEFKMAAEPDKPQPTAPEEANSEEMDNILRSYHKDRIEFMEQKKELSKLQSAMDTYLDSGADSQNLLSDIGCSNILELFDRIKRLKIQTNMFLQQERVVKERLNEFL